MLDENIKGLSYEAVERSRAENGSNMLERKRGLSFFGRFIKNLSDPIIRVLIIAFFITILFSGGEGAFFEGVGIAASILISTFVSTLSEYGSEKAFQKMQREAGRQACTVIRNGEEQRISVEDVVLGDYVLIKSGDKVAADGIMVSGALTCDMSAINGESVERHKYAKEGQSELGSPDDSFSMYRGSSVTAGSGVIRVTGVGKNTYYGRIAGEIQESGGDSPLRKKLSRLAKTLSRFGYLCAFAVAVAYLINAIALDSSFVFTAKNIAKELMHAFTLAISVVVVAVPEGLPMMITVVLSSNMIRMQKQNIRVRKPVGIETAGNIDILFTDKTGTLTYGKPKPVCYITGDGARSGRSIDMSAEQRFLLGTGALHAGESRVEGSNLRGKKRAVSGDVTDRAILSEYLEGADVPKGTKRIALMPFNSKVKMSAAYVELYGNREYSRLYGESMTFVKGAPEILLKHCKYCYGRDGKRNPIDKEMLFSKLDAIASKGIRAIALVTSSSPRSAIERAGKRLSEGKLPDTDELFDDACFLCFIGIRDELRREAAHAVKTMTKAGIQTVMITGDAKNTAVAIARDAGIIQGGLYESVIESEDLRAMSDEDVAKLLPSLRVVARALPDDKSRLVRIAKRCGRITGMTGDGLNDAPALKAADVGFAMGSGTEVAKESGDIIITNNDISSIERAVLYGRTIFRSIRKFVIFQLIMNLSAVGISIIGPFIGWESPVTVIQMLWINLIMDTLAAIAFAGEAPNMQYMREPPLSRDEPVLNGDMITRIFVMGIVTVMICLYFYYSPSLNALFYGRGSESFMSGFFALFVFCGIFGAFNARSGRLNIMAGLFKNPTFIVVMAAVFTAQVGMICFGGNVLRCVPLTISQMKSVILLSLCVLPSGVALELLLKSRFISPCSEVIKNT